MPCLCWNEMQRWFPRLNSQTQVFLEAFWIIWSMIAQDKWKSCHLPRNSRLISCLPLRYSCTGANAVFSRKTVQLIGWSWQIQLVHQRSAHREIQEPDHHRQPACWIWFKHFYRELHRASRRSCRKCDSVLGQSYSKFPQTKVWQILDYDGLPPMDMCILCT